MDKEGNIVKKSGERLSKLSRETWINDGNVTSPKTIDNRNFIGQDGMIDLGQLYRNRGIGDIGERQDKIIREDDIKEAVKAAEEAAKAAKEAKEAVEDAKKTETEIKRETQKSKRYAEAALKASKEARGINRKKVIKEGEDAISLAEKVKAALDRGKEATEEAMRAAEAAEAAKKEAEQAAETAEKTVKEKVRIEAKERAKKAAEKAEAAKKAAKKAAKEVEQAKKTAREVNRLFARKRGVKKGIKTAGAIVGAVGIVVGAGIIKENACSRDISETATYQEVVQAGMTPEQLGLNKKAQSGLKEFERVFEGRKGWDLKAARNAVILLNETYHNSFEGKIQHAIGKENENNCDVSSGYTVEEGQRQNYVIVKNGFETTKYYEENDLNNLVGSPTFSSEIAYAIDDMNKIGQFIVERRK